MNEILAQLEQMLQFFDKKKQKKYRIQTFINLCNKIIEIKDDEIIALITESYNLLREIRNDEYLKPRKYLKSFANLQKVVRKKLGYTEKGQIKSEYTGMGIALGVAFGGPFIAINPAFVGIGLPIGLAIGLAIGEKKEKEAVALDKVY